MLTEPPAQSPAASRIDRRTLLRGGVLGASLTAFPAALSAGLGSGFTSGVASGEPGADGVLLWTRYKAAQDTALEWQLADDMSFGRIVAGGTVTAHAERDWCVKPRAEGLAPGRWYYYRFLAPDGSASDIGRTRTLPIGAVERFRMAAFSCSNLGFGWFNAYAHAAEADEFDLLLHLGDYYYEYQAGNYPSAQQALAGREIWPANEITSLADYRLRHASYRADPDLQRLTQLYPMVMVWDDHETANDSWQNGAENHQEGAEGSWSARKGAAMCAYREWLPVSDADWASYDIGELATLFRLDTRLAGRSQPFDLQKILAGKANAAEMESALTAFRDDGWRDPSRSMMGLEQEAWLAEGLKASRRAGRQWQVLAQQVLIGKLASPQQLLEGLGDSVPDYLRGRVRAGALASRTGLPLNMDAWDGYPAARERLFATALEADANLVVLAGDTHNAWAFDLAQTGEKVGVEFGVQGVTSPGLESYLSMIAPERMASALVERNPELVWADTSHRGYMAVELTPERASCEWRMLGGVRQRSSALARTHRLAAAAGERSLSGG